MRRRLAGAILGALAAAGLPAASAAQPALDAGRIRTDTFTYTVRFDGDELGTLQVGYGRTADGGLRVRERVTGSLGDETTTYAMTGDLRPLSAHREGRLARASAALDLTYGEGAVSGEATVRADSARPGQHAGDTRRVEVDRELPPGTLDSNMLVAALLASPLAPGDTLRYPIFRPGRGVVEARALVAGADSVEVPAGTFDTYRVQLSTDQGSFVLWVTRERPRALVRQAFASRPVEVLLRSVGAAEPPPGAASRRARSSRHSRYRAPTSSSPSSKAREIRSSTPPRKARPASPFMKSAELSAPARAAAGQARPAGSTKRSRGRCCIRPDS